MGETIIPGFIGPTTDLYNIIGDIGTNQSLGTYLMSLLGIKYVAILGDPGDSVWPGATGQVSEGGWGGGYFPQGNATFYAHILESWSYLKVVYRNTNLTILYNSNYVGNAYFFSQYQSPYSGDRFTNLTVPGIVGNITTGNYNQLYNNIKTGRNVIFNPNLTDFSGWSFYPNSGNATFLSNGTVELRSGSLGASLSQNVVLQPNTTYEISLLVNAKPGYPGFPPNGYYRNFIGLYWNQGTGYNGTPGAFIGGYFNGNTSGKETFIFVTPQHNGSINAQLSLSYEPPVGNYTIFTRYSDLSIHPINGSIIFENIVKPFPLIEKNSAAYIAGNETNFTDGYVILDTAYNSQWVASTSNGTVLHSQSGPLGLLEFHVSNGTTIKSIHFTGATSYAFMLKLGWSLFGLLDVVFLSSLFLESRRNLP